MIINIFLSRLINLTIYILIFVALFSAKDARAVEYSTNSNWNLVSNKTKEICDSVQNISIPSQDLPTHKEKKSLKKCYSLSLYYGFKSTPDYSKARKCALIKNDYDILAMIYANGKGVKPNLNIALHYACMLDAAPAEMEGRINYLYKMRDKNNSKNSKATFDICDHASSSGMTAWCAGISHELKAVQQKNYLDIFKDKLTRTEKIAFQKLQKESVIYFEARKTNEIDKSGVYTATFKTDEEMNLNEKMLKLLKKTEQCKLLDYTRKHYQAMDNRLNFLYYRIQKHPPQEFDVPREGIKKTERAWIKYRDSWVNFGHIKCPNISVETWKTIITQERVEQLKEFTS